MRSNVDRVQDKEKTGVFTGSYAVNPVDRKFFLVGQTLFKHFYEDPLSPLIEFGIRGIYFHIPLVEGGPKKRKRSVKTMAVPYNHRAVEEKWRKHWEEHPVNVNDGKKPKYYCLT